MQQVFISQPMKGRTEKEILFEREAMFHQAKELGVIEENAVMIDSFMTNKINIKNYPLWCLSKSLEMMAEADVVLFGPDYKKARGCKIEHECAKSYGIKIIECQENTKEAD